MVADREITEFKETQKDKSAEMREWYKERDGASDSVKGALVFFNNHYAGFGPGSVDEFRRLAGMREDEFPWRGIAATQKGLGDRGRYGSLRQAAGGLTSTTSASGGASGE